MLNFSFSELLVVAVVGFIALKPGELKSSLKFVMGLIAKLKREYQTFMNDLNKEVKYITDLEGNQQRTYDTDKMFKDIKGKRDDQ